MPDKAKQKTRISPGSLAQAAAALGFLLGSVAAMPAAAEETKAEASAASGEQADKRPEAESRDKAETPAPPAKTKKRRRRGPCDV